MTLLLSLILSAIVILAVIYLLSNKNLLNTIAKKHNKIKPPSEPVEDVQLPRLLDEEEQSVEIHIEKDQADTAHTPQLSSNFNQVFKHDLHEKDRLTSLLPPYYEGRLNYDYAAVLPVNGGYQSQTLSGLARAQMQINDALSVTYFANGALLKNEPHEGQKLDEVVFNLKLCSTKNKIQVEHIKIFHELVHAQSRLYGVPAKFSQPEKSIYNTIDYLEKFKEKNNLVIRINLMAQEEQLINGSAIKKAALTMGMHYGALKFFHKVDPKDKTKTLFYLMNKYKPGYFEFDQMHETNTPGVTLLMRPALLNDPLEEFDKMCRAGKEMAQYLDATVVTSKGALLDENERKAIENEIADYQQFLFENDINTGDDKAYRLFS